MWKRADETSPTGDASPTDYRWKLSQNCFEPDWFQGNSVPESLTSELTSTVQKLHPPMKKNQNQTRLGVTVMRMMRKCDCDEQKNSTFFNQTKINSLMGHPSYYNSDANF